MESNDTETKIAGLIRQTKSLTSTINRTHRNYPFKEGASYHESLFLKFDMLANFKHQAYNYGCFSPRKPVQVDGKES